MREVASPFSDTAASVILIRNGCRLYAYRNECPHSHGRLNSQTGRFLTGDGTQLLCAYHLARFRFSDGYCTDGPCRGKSLCAVEVSEVRGSVFAACPGATG